MKKVREPKLRNRPKERGEQSGEGQGWGRVNSPTGTLPSSAWWDTQTKGPILARNDPFLAVRSPLPQPPAPLPPFGRLRWQGGSSPDRGLASGGDRREVGGLGQRGADSQKRVVSGQNRPFGLCRGRQKKASPSYHSLPPPPSKQASLPYPKR